jgi:K(+)-stimulated pyrophosphate-energized sodium pump
MNLVSVLIAPAIVGLTIGDGANNLIRWSIALVALVIVVTSVAISRNREIAFGGDADEDVEPVPAQSASV